MNRKSKYKLINGWYIDPVDHRQVRFCVVCEGEFYKTSSEVPHINKNGNYDRYWLIRKCKELLRIVETKGIMGIRTPAGISYTELTPTTGIVPQLGYFIQRENYDV